jgi:tRNA pseudouridine55 synthase
VSDDGAEALSGVVVVDKPSGWTSHQVVGRARRLLGTRKVGHAGTLDPMASGVLVLGVGRATRLLGRLALTDKAYDATIRLGQSTVTDDAEGDVVGEADASGIDDAAILVAVAGLTGEIAQVPSAVSAIKVDGKRAYQRVRTGESVVLEARRVTISRFDVREVRRQGHLIDVDVQVECSTGTYVRALARDLGSALGVGGHVTALRRTRVGPFGLAAAHTLEELEAELDIVPLDAAASAGFPTYTLEAADVPAVRNGRTIQALLGAAGPVALLSEDGRFLALYEQQGPRARAVAVFDPA